MGAKMMEVEGCRLRFPRTVNGEWWRTKQPRWVDLHWQTEIQALKVEVEVEGEVQPSWNGVQWRGNGVQAKLRKKGCEGWWRVLWDM